MADSFLTLGSKTVELAVQPLRHESRHTMQKAVTDPQSADRVNINKVTRTTQLLLPLLLSLGSFLYEVPKTTNKYPS